MNAGMLMEGQLHVQERGRGQVARSRYGNGMRDHGGGGGAIRVGLGAMVRSLVRILLLIHAACGYCWSFYPHLQVAAVSSKRFAKGTALLVRPYNSVVVASNGRTRIHQTRHFSSTSITSLSAASTTTTAASDHDIGLPKAQQHDKEELEQKLVHAHLRASSPITSQGDIPKRHEIGKVNVYNIFNEQELPKSSIRRHDHNEKSSSTIMPKPQPSNHVNNNNQSPPYFDPLHLSSSLSKISVLDLDLKHQQQQQSNSGSITTSTTHTTTNKKRQNDNNNNNNDITIINQHQSNNKNVNTNTKSPSFRIAISDLWKARLLLLSAAALYGTNFALVKILDEYLPVGASTSLRFGLASLATLPFIFQPVKNRGVVVNDVNKDSGGGFMEEVKKTLPSLFAGMEVGLWTSVGYIAQAIGLETIDASKSAFICSLAVVVVPLLDAISGKSIKPRAIIGVICAIIGVALLELPNPMEFVTSLVGGVGGGTFSMPLFSTGDVCTFLQPIMFGIGFWRMEYHMDKHPDEATRMTAGQLLSVAVLSLANCYVGIGDSCAAPVTLNQVWTWVTNPMILLALLWTGVITTALTVYMETLALKTVSAAEAALIFSTEPIWGAGFASVVVGEHLGASALTGAGFILSGCAVSTMGGDDSNKNHDDDSDGGQKLGGEGNSQHNESSLSRNDVTDPALEQASIGGSIAAAAQAQMTAQLQGMELVGNEEAHLSAASSGAESLTSAIVETIAKVESVVDVTSFTQAH